MAELDIDPQNNKYKVVIDDSDKEFLEKIAPRNVVGIISDSIQYFRFNNAIKMFQKVDKKCRENKIDPKKIAPKFLITFFENAGLEEDKKLQVLWENILYNTVSTGDDNSYYLGLINSLTLLDVKILDICFENIIKSHNGDYKSDKAIFSIDGISSVLNENKDVIEISLQKMLNIGILKYYSTPFSINGKSFANGNPVQLGILDDFRISNIGWDFIKKCNENI